MKGTGFLFAILLTVLAVCCAFQVEGQTPYYVTIESGQNYALQTNQVVSLVGYDYSLRPQVFAALQDGTSVQISPTGGAAPLHKQNITARLVSA
jgi:hypothetical protein